MVTYVEPHITFELDHSSNDFYSLIALDHDFPSRENPSLKECVLWMVVNISKGDMKTGVPVLPYQGPSPGMGTGFHRIYFFLFRHPTKFTNVQINTFKAYFENRESINIWKWASSLGVGEPTAADGFSCEWDESCQTNLTDLLWSTSHTKERSADPHAHHGISDGCCGVEKMLIKFSTYHTIPCPFVACCSELQIDEDADNESAKHIAHMANKSLLMRFSQYHTIDCFSFIEDDIEAARREEEKEKTAVCSKFKDYETVSCCQEFDYRDMIHEIWTDFTVRIKDIWERFVGYRTLGCCEGQEDIDGPEEIVRAKKIFEHYQTLHREVFFLIILLFFFNK